jgi:hypothetical protein
MAELMLVNPRRRRKGRKAKAKTGRRSLVARASSGVRTKLRSIRRRYRSNPIGGRASSALDQFKTGAIGAAGALAVDIAIQRLPLPDSLKTGQLAPIVKGFIGIGIGMAVAKFGKNRELGKKLAQGAVTVSLYNAGKEMLKGPLGLSDDGLLGFSDSGLLDGDFDDYGMGAHEFGAYESGGPIVQ